MRILQLGRIASIVLISSALTGCGSGMLRSDSPSADTTYAPSDVASAGDSIAVATVNTPEAIPWRGYQSDRQAQAFVEKGSGRFVADAEVDQMGKTTLNGVEGVTVNLRDAPIVQAAKIILGDILGVNYLVSEKVSGSITIRTSAPIDRDALIDIFETALKLNGATIVRGNGSYSIVPASTAAQLGISQVGLRSGPGIGLRVIPLKYVSAAEIRRVVEAVAPKDAILNIDDARGLLMLSGTERQLDDMAELVSLFDVDWLKGMSFALFPVKASEPQNIVRELETVFGLDNDGPLKGTVRFVPNERLGSILVISSKPGYIDRAKSWIERLDQLAQGGEERLFVYKVRNRSANELADLLSSVLANAGSGNATGVAPRYEAATAAFGAQDQGFDGQSMLERPSPSANTSNEGRGQFDNGPEPLVGGSESAVGGESSSRHDRSKVVADEGNNTLLVMATPKEYRRIFSILEQIDVLPTQVMLEAVIAEVTLNDELKFGLKWYFEKHRGEFTFSDAVSGTVASAFPGFSYFFSTSNIRIALDALSGVTNVNVVSAPSLMVLDNRKAILQVGDQVPIVTQTSQSVAAPDAPVINSISMKDTGVILAVTPRVNNSGRVVLEIEQEVSNVAQTTSSGIDSPTIQQRRIKTTVAVGDGEVLALGGLIQERDNERRTQVPLLGSIPIIGAPFRTKTDRIDRTELLIFIRPVVVRDAVEARAITEEFRKRINIQTPTSKRGRNLLGRDAGRILR